MISIAGFPSGGWITWCVIAHSLAQSPDTAMSWKSSSCFNILLPFAPAKAFVRNFWIAGLPTTGSIPGNNVTPSSAQKPRIAVEAMRKALVAAGFEVDSSDVVMRPNGPLVTPSGEALEQFEKLLERLNGLDDVDEVYHNAVLPAQDA